MLNYDNKAGSGLLLKVLGGAGVVGGIWMIIAPFALNYSGATVFDAKAKKAVPVDLTAVTVSDIVVGVALIALVGFALLTANNAALARFRFYATIAAMVVGVYLIAAPYIFDVLKVASYMSLDKPNTNDQLIGIVTVVLSGFALQLSSPTSEPATTTTVEAATPA
jgi:uncharacterized membrane protein YbhN (UPF0104 family)